MAHKKIMMGSAALGLAVVGLTVASMVVPMAATASAQGMARQSVRAFTTLSLAEQTKIQARTSMGIATDLQAAQAARDAHTLSYTEAAAQYPAIDSAVPHDLVFVSFTREDGAKILIGLDNHRLPVYELVNDIAHGNAASSMRSDGAASPDSSAHSIDGSVPLNGPAKGGWTIHN